MSSTVRVPQICWASVRLITVIRSIVINTRWTRAGSTRLSAQIVAPILGPFLCATSGFRCWSHVEAERGFLRVCQQKGIGFWCCAGTHSLSCHVSRYFALYWICYGHKMNEIVPCLWANPGCDRTSHISHVCHVGSASPLSRGFHSSSHSSLTKSENTIEFSMVKRVDLHSL